MCDDIGLQKYYWTKPVKESQFRDKPIINSGFYSRFYFGTVTENYLTWEQVKNDEYIFNEIKKKYDELMEKVESVNKRIYQEKLDKLSSELMK